jgi:predicted regulator of Ras-like GTPase activity (Roadblock/LC7/MglB family)
MFVEALREVVDNTDGALSGLLMDFEGIAVQSYSKDGAPFDIDVVGAEFSVIIKSVQRAVESLEAGGAREIAVQADKVVTLIRVLNADYFVAITLGPDGNVGKGRFLLRVAAPKLLEELS